MRVLGLVTDAFGGSGGIASVTRDVILTISVVPEVEEVIVITRRGGGFRSHLPKNVIEFAPRQSKISFCVVALQGVLSAKPAIIYCNHLFMSPLAAALARIVGARLIIHLHGIEAWQCPTIPQRLALEFADLLLCVSRYTRKRILSTTAVSPEKAVVLNNGILNSFTLGDREAARSKFNIGSEFVILTVGRLSSVERYKGHERVILALHRLRNANPRVLYLIAGEGDDRPRLTKLAHDAGLSDCVRFLGAVPQADLPDLYRAADLFAMPSTGEGFGIAYAEAMGCGTPAIGLTVGGAQDALDAVHSGFAVEPGQFENVMVQWATREFSERAALSRKTHQIFGQDAFRQHLQKLLLGLQEPRNHRPHCADCL